MEFFLKLLQMPFAEQISNFHGLLAIVSLFLYGAIFTSILVASKFSLEALHKPLLYMLGIQTLIIAAASTVGMTIYIAYRSPGGAREFLLSSPATSWLHTIAFEYKEYLCSIVPWLLLLIAFFVILRLGPAVLKNRPAVRLLLAFVTTSALFVLITATMAVLIAKIAPLEKFLPGNDILAEGGLSVITAMALAVLVAAAIYILINFTAKKDNVGRSFGNSLASMMYGAAAGLTVSWILNIVQTANSGFARAVTYVPSVGPYSGVIAWSLMAVFVATLAIWLITLGIRKQMSLIAAGWVLIICALVQVVAFFPPFFELFIG